MYPTPTDRNPRSHPSPPLWLFFENTYTRLIRYATALYTYTRLIRYATALSQEFPRQQRRRRRRWGHSGYRTRSPPASSAGSPTQPAMSPPLSGASPLMSPPTRGRSQCRFSSSSTSCALFRHQRFKFYHFA